jgi:hypothetical protein
VTPIFHRRLNSAQVSGELGWFSTHRWYQVPDYTTNPARRAAGEAAEHWSLKVLLLLIHRVGAVAQQHYL